MFQLSVQDIHPGAQAGDKEEAIRQVAAALCRRQRRGRLRKRHAGARTADLHLPR